MGPVDGLFREGLGPVAGHCTDKTRHSRQWADTRPKHSRTAAHTFTFTDTDAKHNTTQHNTARIT